jgi:hypothetical protein
MSYDVDTLLARLANEFKIEGSPLEYGSCRLYRATSTGQDERSVWVYVPRPEVWAVSKARTALAKQFSDYLNTVDADRHPSLPAVFEHYSERETRVAPAIVLPRAEAARVSPDHPGFDYPSKQSAILRLAEGIDLLEKEGIHQPPVCEQTVFVCGAGDRVNFLLDKVFFHAPAGPAPVLLFGPAFLAPEFIDLETEEVRQASTSGSGPAHVYALAKYFIYGLLGPAGLVRVFAGTAPGQTEPSTSAALGDNQLWNNLARSRPEVSRVPLEEAYPREMPRELVDLLVRSVSYDPARRPADTGMLLAGLTSTLGRLRNPPHSDLDSGGSGKPGGNGGKKKDWGLLPWIAAAVLMAVLLGGLGLFLQNEEQKREIAQAREAMEDACRPVGARLSALEESVFAEHPGWAEATGSFERARQLHQDDAQLAATAEHCRAAENALEAVVSGTMADRQSALRSEIRFAQLTGAASEGLDIEAGERLLLGRAVSDEELLGLEQELRAATEDLVDNHSAVLEARASTLVETVETVARTWLVEDDATPAALQDVRATLDAPRGSQRLRDLHEKTVMLGEGAREALVGDLESWRTAFRVEIAGLRDGLGDLDEIEELSSRIHGMATAIPLSVADADAAYETLSGIADALAALRERLLADTEALRALRAQVAEIAERAETEGWVEDEALRTALADFGEIPDSPSELAAVRAATGNVEERASELVEEWQEGRGACETFLGRLERSGPVIAGLDVEQALREVAAATPASDAQPASRENFALCRDGLERLDAALLQADARAAWLVLAATRQEAIDFGVDQRVPGFAEAEREFSDLDARGFPGDAASRDRFIGDIGALDARYRDAMTVPGCGPRGGRRPARGRSTADAGCGGLVARGLPVWQETLAALPVVEGDDPISDAVVLAARVRDLGDVLRRFENGEFVDCTIGALDMNVVSIGEREVSALMAGPLSQATSGAYLDGARARILGQHCLSALPVTVADLRAWRDTLGAAQQLLLIEIDAVMPGPEGIAHNTSHFLAVRYAEWLSRRSGRTVCVAPAELTLQARIDDRSSTTGPEITASECDSGDLRDRVVVIDTANMSAPVSCVPVNDRVRDAGFRIAAGDICGGP